MKHIENRLPYLHPDSALWRCFEPPARPQPSDQEMHRLFKDSLTETERRRCAALKGWRTRRAKA